MAYSNTSKTYLMLNLAIILSLVFISCIAESRVQKDWAQTEDDSEGGNSAELVCSKPYGVEAGDTCIQIAQGQNIVLDKFNKLNPNLVCQNLFVGQWICVAGNV